MEIIRIDQIPFSHSPRGPRIRKVLSHESFAITEVVLDASGELPPHKTPVDVFFYVRKGSGMVSIGDEEQKVFEGDLVFSPKNVPHGLKAWESGFSVLVVKAPNPAFE